MKKILIAFALLLAQIAPVTASEIESPEGAPQLRTFVKMVEDIAIKAQQDKSDYCYNRETMECASKLGLKSVPLGERYDLLVRLVDICKKYYLNGCLVHFVPGAILVSYTEDYLTLETDKTGSSEAQRLSFLEMIMRDLATVKYDSRIFDESENRLVIGYAIRQARSQAVPKDLRLRYAEFFKTYNRSNDTMRIFYSIMSGIENPRV